MPVVNNKKVRCSISKEIRCPPPPLSFLTTIYNLDTLTTPGRPKLITSAFFDTQRLFTRSTRLGPGSRCLHWHRRSYAEPTARFRLCTNLARGTSIECTDNAGNTRQPCRGCETKATAG